MKRAPGLSGRSPVTPGNEGRYDGFDVLDELPYWDPVTAGVVLERLHPEPTLRFFSGDEEPAVRALFDLLLGQHAEPRVPVTELVDARLALGETDGWRYDDMPEDGEAWHRSMGALDEEARSVAGAPFAALSIEAQGAIVQRVHDSTTWRGFPAAHLWSLWTRYAMAAFYSHPWAWNEMGFGGPAYPRGYKNLGIDRREPFERQERDAADPVPWARRREAAKESHAARFAKGTPQREAGVDDAPGEAGPA